MPNHTILSLKARKTKNNDVRNVEKMDIIEQIPIDTKEQDPLKNFIGHLDENLMLGGILFHLNI